MNLKTAIGDRSLDTAAELTGIDSATLQAIMNGRELPDLYILAKLELSLDASIWPRLH